MPNPDQWAAEVANQGIAKKWFETSNPATYTGTRHHTVPALILRRFSDERERLSVWRRSTEDIRPGNVSDLAIRDFYTTLNVDGSFDGRMEEQLGSVETAAKPVIDWLLSPLRGRRLSRQQHAALCALVAFQMVRGPRRRKEDELLAEYGVKILNDGSLSEADLRDTVIVPHPNEHIRLMGPLSEAIFLSILRRPAQVIRLDAPLLVICDEPVLVDVENHVRHLPECSLSEAELRRRQRERPGYDGTFQQPIHIWTTRPAGVNTADAIAMPVAPDALIALGPIGQTVPHVLTYKADEARKLAEEVNAALVKQAYEWVAANPGHPDFANFTFPPPGPLIGVCDGGSIMSQQLQTAPVLRWQRIKKDWR